MCYYSRISYFGAPKNYDTFVDEGLNLLLRQVAARAHKLKYEFRIFRLFNLHGLFNLYLFGAQWDDED